MSKYRQLGRRFERLVKQLNQFCKHCRQAYTPTAPHQKYCCHACRSAAHRRRHRVRTLLCTWCRRAYLVVQTGSPGPRSLYCCNACRQAAYRDRKRQRLVDAVVRGILKAHSAPPDLALARPGNVWQESMPDGSTWCVTRTLWGTHREKLSDGPGTDVPD